MEKTRSSSKALYHCLSLAEVVGFLILDSILIWAERLRKYSNRFLTYYSSGTCTAERKNRKNTPTDEAREEREIGREDVEIILERMGMSLTSGGSDKLKDCMGLDEISATFEEKEPSSEEVIGAFCVFDENCDGFIDAKELQRVLCKLGFKEGEDIDACRKMIETYDENKDGKIDFNQFARFLECSFC